MNERVLNDPLPARELNPEITPALQEILNRALERDPRHRYSTATRWPGTWNTRSKSASTMPHAARSRLVSASPAPAVAALHQPGPDPGLLFCLMLLLARL